jgi:DNA mismatch repair protein MutS
LILNLDIMKTPEDLTTPETSSPFFSMDPAALTPMLSQYLEIKRKYPDAILFYRMGDFYELFLDDAVKAAPLLEVQLTSRDKNAVNPIPMCGVPYHSVTGYLQKLLDLGMKVAICEQMEEPGAGKGILKRDVTRVLTPALIGDPELVPEENCNLLFSIHEKAESVWDLCVLDLLAGQVQQGEITSFAALLERCAFLPPKEILSNAAPETQWLKDLRKLYPGVLYTRREAFFETTKQIKGKSMAYLALESYLKETQKLSQIPHLGSPLPLEGGKTLGLDATTISSLEIVRAAGEQGVNGPTLFNTLNFTLTPMGRRMLRDWLVRPLCEVAPIRRRLESVKNFVDDMRLADDLRSSLTQIRDLERLTTKTALGLSMPRDLVAIREILRLVPELKTRLSRAQASRLKAIGTGLWAISDLTSLLGEALEDFPPSTLRDGGIFRETYRPEIAEYRALSRDGKSMIAAIEAREKTKTGISSLKVRYSKVFGYTIEITKSYLDRIPGDYIRKQTIANGERFITEELKSLEEKIVTADQRLRSLEESLFVELRRKVGEKAAALLANAKLMGELDVLLSFSRASRERGFQKPEIHEGWEMTIDEGRHPVVEALLPQGQFVPNSVLFSEEECRTIVITGPNMGGKSTIMRQVALIAILAHAGCFVPARSAKIPLVDAIFTRIGSSDDLARGRSTFMVEMMEVVRILTKASARSLILIDEIGRGTSTYDGLSLAWALLEHIHTQLSAKTLFATHFHELTMLEKSLPQLINFHALVEKWKEEIVFLYRLARGVSPRSYGIEVAKLAGLPAPVLTRARQLQSLLEGQSQRNHRGRSRALEIHDNQMVFFDELKALENRSELET